MVLINRYTIILAGLGLAILAGMWFYMHKRDSLIVSPILRPDVKEKITVDPLHHSLTIVTDKGVTAIHLPDRPSSIEVLKSGKLRLSVPQMGFEHIPFIAIGYSNQLNDYVGMDFYYWRALDLGLAVSFDRELKIKALGIPIMVSYTIYHRLRLSAGYSFIGSNNQVHGALSVRI